MNRYSPVDVERRAEHWRQSGWKNFDQASKSYTAEDLARERENERKVESDAPTLPTRTRRIYVYEKGNKPAQV